MRRLRLFVLLVLAVPLAGLGWYIGDTIEKDNFRVVTESLYRAGQLRLAEWHESHAEHRYRSVLNLRGSKQGRPWYELERSFAADKALNHYDFELAADVAPSVEDMEKLIALMRAAPKPLLVHCKEGADRSGLVSALYVYAIDGVPAAQASRQLSLWYGHFPWLTSRTGAMDDAFVTYVQAHPEL